MTSDLHLYLPRSLRHEFAIQLLKYGTFCRVCSVACRVLDGFIPYLAQMITITSMRGCVDRSMTNVIRVVRLFLGRGEGYHRRSPIYNFSFINHVCRLCISYTQRCVHRVRTLLSFVWVQSLLASFTILFSVTGAIIHLPQYQRNNNEKYGQNTIITLPQMPIYVNEHAIPTAFCSTAMSVK